MTGICQDCGQPHGRAKNAKRCLACVKEREKAYSRSYVKRLTAGAKAFGICAHIGCLSQDLSTKTLCAQHAAEMRTYAAGRYQAAKTFGRCRRCGEPVAASSKIHCEYHKRANYRPWVGHAEVSR